MSLPHTREWQIVFLNNTMKKSKTGLNINDYKKLTGSKFNTDKKWKSCKPEHLVDIDKLDFYIYNNLDITEAYNQIRPHSKKIK